MTAFKRWRNHKRYAAKLNLRAKIEREIAPILAETRRVSDSLANGYVGEMENSPECYDLTREAVAVRYGYAYKTGGHLEAPDTCLVDNAPIIAAGEAMAARDAARNSA